MSQSFKTEFDFTRRCQLAIIARKRSNKIPIVVQPLPETKPALIALKNKACSFPSDVTFQSLMTFVRKKIQEETKVKPEEAIFFSCEKTSGQKVSIAGTALLSQVYKENQQEDGWVYVYYTRELVFG